ncbi:hypothetical protein [Candidatus Lariskella endosymbiont of Hedychridium roseum]|uniref:hypothetical protein n=1 Tax=Candidatus Lariskella endosymbiont of Hedychridium roseum TaxID=3077949 RepID=UPI0030D19238
MTIAYSKNVNVMLAIKIRKFFALIIIFPYGFKILFSNFKHYFIQLLRLLARVLTAISGEKLTSNLSKRQNLA